MLVIMKNKTLLIFAALINLTMIFLLIHKQNKIIKMLYEMQQLHEQQDDLLQQKKVLTLAFHKGQQLSTIQHFAKNKLLMNPITLKEAKTINSPTDQKINDSQPKAEA